MAEDILETAKKRFKLVVEAESTQRDRETEDLRFQVPELQWDEQAKASRAGGIPPGGGTPIPARPILSIPKLDQPIQLVLNQERAAQLGINIHPVSPEANEEVAEVIQGIYRSIERDSNARTVRSWAFDRAVKCGRGAYRIVTEWDDEGGHPFDQNIRLKRILYQEAVYFDPSATQPDFSDANWVFVTSWVAKEDFERLYPKAEMSSQPYQNWADPNRSEPLWVRANGETQAYLVAEYFYKEIETETLCLLKDGTVVLKSQKYPDELKALDQDGKPIEREMEKTTVRWCKLCEAEILGEEVWPGKYIPIIPVIGKELQPFEEGEGRRWVGIIGPAKDTQRVYNWAASTAVELAALEPKSPFIGAEGQFEGHEDEWHQANVRNFPYLEYKPKSLDGTTPLPPPQRAQIDASRLGVSMQLLQMSDSQIQAATAQWDPSLGRSSSKERSGRAIMANQQQSDAANSHFMHNLADISMQYEARVVLDLIPVIYDRPGRLARTLDLQDDTEQVILNQPFYKHPQTGRPVGLPPGPGGQPMQPPMMPPAGGNGAPPPGMGMAPPGGPPGMAAPPVRPKVMEYDLRKGTYSVSVTIGRSYQSKLQEGQEEIGEILQAQPNLMPIIGPLYFKYRDFPGAREIADLLLKVRQKQMPELESGDEGTPEQTAAQLAQAKQQMEMLQQQNQQLQQALQTEQAKQQATLQKAQMDNSTKESIARIEQMTTLLREQMITGAKGNETVLSHANEQAITQKEVAGQVASEAIKAQAQLAAADLNFKAANTQSLGKDVEPV